MIETKIRAYLKTNLSPKRLRHSEATGQTAAELCRAYNHPPYNGMLAGLSHDISRELTRTQLVKTASIMFTPEDWELDNWVLLHGKAGATTLRYHFGIHDSDVLEAVALHTTGTPGMRDLAKIVYIADYIEPNRTHVTETFKEGLQQCTLDEAFRRILEHKVRYCTSIGKQTAPPTEELLSFLRIERLRK